MRSFKVSHTTCGPSIRLCAETVWRGSSRTKVSHFTVPYRTNHADSFIAAAAIIQMPFRPYTPDGYASKDITSNRHKDVIYHFHAQDDFEGQQKKRKQKEATTPEPRASALSLALRPRKLETTEVSDESASENEDFRLVTKRCKVEPDQPASEIKSEPATEDEYEVVTPNVDVEVLSTDEEEETLPKVLSLPNDLMPDTLPTYDGLERTATSDGADSDSDWTVL